MTATVARAALTNCATKGLMSPMLSSREPRQDRAARYPTAFPHADNRGHALPRISRRAVCGRRVARRGVGAKLDALVAPVGARCAACSRLRALRLLLVARR